MKGSVIHVIQNDAEDWLVQEEGGRELGHYCSEREAEAIARAIARKRKGVVRFSTGGHARHTGRGAWWRRFIGA